MLAFVIERVPVGAFLSADKKNHVVACRKIPDMRHAVGHLPADGIVVPEGGTGRNMFFYVLYDFPEPVQGLCGL